jgi:hypothetical protein
MGIVPLRSTPHPNLYLAERQESAAKSAAKSGEVRPLGSAPWRARNLSQEPRDRQRFVLEFREQIDYDSRGDW